MPLSAPLVWEVRATGNPLNGGAYNAAKAGVAGSVDYSQQDAAQVSYTDLAVDATTNTNVTSAAFPFSAAHVGNLINISGSSPWAAGFYEILALGYSSNNAIVSGATLNGDFETAGAGGADVFASWAETATGASTVNRDTAVFHGGTAACRLDVDGSNSLVQVSQVFTAQRYYSYSFWGKCASGTATVIVGNDQAGGTGNSHTLTTTWTQFTGTFTTGTTNGSFVLKRSIATGNSIYFDDVVLAPCAAVLDRSPAAAGSTGGVGKLGGATDSPYTIQSVVVASNVVWMRSGSYPPMNVAFTATSTTPTTTAPLTRFSGYGTARGDGGRATITASVGTNQVFKVLNGWYVTNLVVNGNSGSGYANYGLYANGYTGFYNCKASGCAIAGIASLSFSTIYACEAAGMTTSSSVGISANRTDVIGCYVHDSTGIGIASVGTNGDANYNVVANCTVDGIQLSSLSGAIGNTVYNCGRHGINQNTTDGMSRPILNNILAHNGGYGAVFGSAAGNRANVLTDGNAYYANTSGARSNGDDTAVNPQNAVGPHVNTRDVTLTADPFTNAAGGDFTLNSAAGGGAACRAAGIPSSWPGLSMAGYPDLGAAQSQPSGGGGGGGTAAKSYGIGLGLFRS